LHDLLVNLLGTSTSRAHILRYRTTNNNQKDSLENTIMNIAYKIVSNTEKSNIMLKKLKQYPLFKKEASLNFENKVHLKTFIKDKMGCNSRHEF
jgi:hypothetical protein